MEDDAIEAVMRAVSRVTPLQPRPNIWVLVGCIVVDDQMQRDVVGHFAIEFLEEGEPFGVRVFWPDEAGNLAVEIVQRGKERDGAVPDVVMCSGPDMSCFQGQARLRAFESLALTLFVATQNQRFCRRMQLEPDHVPKLWFEIRVRR